MIRAIQHVSKPKPEKNVLQNIRIASPCPANWEHMTGDDRVRHCGECSLSVYNLAAMTKTEAEQLLREKEGRLCIRLYRRADGTIVTQDCPRGLRLAAQRITRVASMVLSALMSVSFAFAQEPHRSVSQNVSNTQATTLSIKVVDSSGKRISNAAIVLRQETNNKEISGQTNAEGVLELPSIEAGKYILTINRSGFNTYVRSIAVDQRQSHTMKIELLHTGEVVFGGAPIVVRDSPITQLPL